MNNFLYALNEQEAQDVSIVGFKAANLATLINQAQIPSSIVISTHLLHYLAPKLNSYYIEMLSKNKGFASINNTSISEFSQICRELILNLKIPSEIVEALLAWANLSNTFAIRSSSTVEDSSESSFAGLFGTFLHVKKEDFVPRILDTWASLYSEHIIHHILHRALSVNKLSMGVLIQEMVDTVIGGVAFTIDPVNGEPYICVNVAQGQTENIVTGTEPSDYYVIDPSSHQVLDNKSVFQTRITNRILTDKHIKSIISLCTSATEHFDKFCDVEFAFDQNALYLLQVRRALSISGATLFLNEIEETTRVNWRLSKQDELVLKPETVLEQDIEILIHDYKRQCYEKTGAPQARNCEVKYIFGYQYHAEILIESKSSNEKYIDLLERAGKYLSDGTTMYRQEIEPIVKREVESLQRAFHNCGDTLLELVSLLEHAITTYAYVMGYLHWKTSAVSGIKTPKLPKLFVRLTGRNQRESDILVSGLTHQTNLLTDSLIMITNIAKKNRNVVKHLETRDYGRLLASNNLESREFRSHFEQLLALFGTRSGDGYGSQTTLMSPTWNMDNTLPLDLIRVLLNTDSDKILATKNSLSVLRRDLISELEQLALIEGKQTFQELQEALFEVQQQVINLENHNFWMEQYSGGLLREIIHAVGIKLTKMKMTSDPADIFHIKINELMKIAKNVNHLDIPFLINSRKKDVEFQSRFSPPAYLARFHTIETRNVRDNFMDLNGVPASMGEFTGRAIVARNPRLIINELSDELILVTRNIGPDFIPLFPIIGGIILELGAVYQHASLMAREYGIPTIVQVKNATQKIASGDLIYINGSTGDIETLKSSYP